MRKETIPEHACAAYAQSTVLFEPDEGVLQRQLGAPPGLLLPLYVRHRHQRQQILVQPHHHNVSVSCQL